MTLLLLFNHDMPESGISSLLDQKKYSCIEAKNLEAGFSILLNDNNDIHVIVVDHDLLMTDISFLKKLRDNEKFRDIPLIVATVDPERENIKPFSHCAPTYWLQPPFTYNSLLSMVTSADREFFHRRRLRREIDDCNSVFENLIRGTFHLKTFEQAESLTAILSRTCPEPDRVALGLFELLANGIEHGNLEISHEEKWSLLENNCYLAEINHRLGLPAYRDRYVECSFERKKDLIVFRIEDQGAGFNYDDYLGCDLSANEKCHGRGIALAQASSFDHLEYIGRGNRVMAVTRFTR